MTRLEFFLRSTKDHGSNRVDKALGLYQTEGSLDKHLVSIVSAFKSEIKDYENQRSVREASPT